MRIIDDQTIRNVEISTEEALTWVDETIRIKREAMLPPKTSIRMEGGSKFYNTMPCVIPSMGIAGVKEVNRYPENTPSLNAHLLLYDLNNGQLKAVMDASYITSLRTAAVGIHSVHLFARKDYRSIAFIGLGEVGSLALRFYVESIGEKEVTIRLYNYKNRAGRFVEQYLAYSNITWELYDSYEEMVADCDVVVSAVTYQEEDFAAPENYKKGCLLVPIHTRGFLACDLVFDKVFGDDTGHLKGFKYFDQFKNFAEICDVVNGKIPGRETDEERIIAYSVGISVHDMVFANRIYEKLNNDSVSKKEN